jgi:hypothetical protein
VGKSKFEKFSNQNIFLGQPKLSEGNKEIERIKEELKNASQFTKEAVDTMINNPTLETIEIAVNEIKKDDALQSEKKVEILKDIYQMNEIKDIFMNRFNFNNCPSDYESLKKEAKFLAGINVYSFALMAQRVIAIRDNKYYEKDGYKGILEFIDNELPVVRQTVNNYINIIENFDVQALGHDNIEYSKLIPFLPLLKAENTDIPKESLKLQIINDSKNKSFREIVNEAKELKIKYGLTVSPAESNIDKELGKLLSRIKKNPDIYNKSAIQRVIDELQKLM